LHGLAVRIRVDNIIIPEPKMVLAVFLKVNKNKSDGLHSYGNGFII